MHRDPVYNRTRSLFTGHAGGAYTLPDAVLERETRAHRIAEQTRAGGMAPTLGDTRARFRADLVAAIDAGAELPDPIVLRQAAEQDAARDELRRLLVDELESAQTHVVATIQSRGEEIIVEHLRPALEELLEAAATAGEKLGRHLPTAEAILSAPEPVRKAFQTLGTLAARYHALRTAQGIVVELTAAARFDTRNLFREFRNLPDVWPQYANPRAEKPWPTTDRGRLLWIVTSGIEAWMPTPEEQDEAFADRFPNAPALRGRRPGWADRRELAGA